MDLRAVIVDDEALARENLRMMVEEHGSDLTVVGVADSVEQALEVIPSTKPDVVFLDIRMPAGVEGFELLQDLERGSFQVVFVTAFRDYAVEGFQANAIDFLLKPIHLDDLQKAARRIRANLARFAQHPASWQVYHRSLDQLAAVFLDQTPARTLTLTLEDRLELLELAEVEAVIGEPPGTRFQLRDESTRQDNRPWQTFVDLLPKSDWEVVAPRRLVSRAPLTGSKAGKGKGNFFQNLFQGRKRAQ